MIYQNVELHNVTDLVPCEGGMLLSRLPQAMRAVLARRAADHAAFYASGVEVRFRILSGEVDLDLHMLDVTEGLPAQIMYGAFQGGWTMSVKAIGRDRTRLHIVPSPNLETLQRITQSHSLPYDPAMIRVLLPYGKVVLDGVNGCVEPPHPEDAPKGMCLSYGSSITHGSLALGSLQCYASRLAGRLGCDSINLGLAGNCHLEPEFAEYIMSRKDWTIATVEMGINMLNAFTKETFRTRVRSFVHVLSAETRPVFTTGIFGFNSDPGPAQRFREILKEETEGRLDHLDGMTLLNDPTLIAEDGVHPSYGGHEQIADRWAAHILQRLG